MKIRKMALAITILLVSACATISSFSPAAYEQATSLKVEALTLMDRASELFVDHRVEAEALTLRVEKAYEFAKGRPKNEISTRQWAILKDPDRNLLGGFLKRWKAQSTLSGVFIQEAKGLVADAFDKIIGLESGKVKPQDVP
ncbi:hypothetical protein HYY27_00640 [bacterium]|nr:hypothetical protein [bacterium]